MGGCRCTYRNCRSQSDGQMHFFHYPVFDKARCHQWLVNGRRFDFLNLKVSQLRNRVVCQHHFKDEMFMNYKKAKLIYDAVPTEDGPNVTNEGLIELHDITMKAIDEGVADPIDADDDKAFTTRHERLSNYSLKYVDYLTNNEMIEVDIPPLNISSNNYYTDKSKGKTFIQNKNTDKQSKECFLLNKDEQAQKKNEENLLKENTDQQEAEKDLVEIQLEKMYENAMKHNRQTRQSSDKVQILHEEKLPNTAKVSNENDLSTAKPITVTPSYVLPMRSKSIVASNISEIITSTPKAITPEKPNLPKENIPLNLNTPIMIKEEGPKIIKVTSLLKKNFHKNSFNISPIKKAAIEKKRNFNMRLRDIVEASLEQVEKDIERDSELNKQAQEKELNKTASVDSNIEKRILDMENRLLLKMRTNANEIKEIKQMLSVKKPLANEKQKIKKITQTVWSEEDDKKYLYAQIAEYLSPKVKNLVYEEMFLNEANTSRKSKRRKVIRELKRVQTPTQKELEADWNTENNSECD